MNTPLRDDLKKLLWKYEDNLHLEELVDEAADQILNLIASKMPEKPIYPDVMEYVAMIKKASENNKYDDMYNNGWYAHDKAVKSILKGGTDEH